MVNMDIEPYSTVAADKQTKKREYITSRKQHREFLKRNGYEEMGSEKFKPDKKKEKDTSESPSFDVFN